METLKTVGENFIRFFTDFADNWVAYLLQFVLFAVLFYLIVKVLQFNKAKRFIVLFVFIVVFCGLTFTLSGFDSQILVLIIAMVALLVFTMFHTEIKRNLLDSGAKKSKSTQTEAGSVDYIIEEIVRAVQSMSKKDIGALIVLSDENLPEGIIESGTIVNAQISAQMIEAVFYPKAPLHDGAMIIEGNKIYAAGCFLPLAQSENLPKEMGSRHRAALGVTTVASVTSIVVSEETGIISIVKNGAVRKKYADAADLRNALSDYFWSDLATEGRL